uniref:Uncharacterized protein n=1 Tax=viral metagenome TaxID=1070528 RepID=A0A6M3M0E9_9ZZZZ
MRLEKIESEFWDYQATVSEEGVIAKILRTIEPGPSMGIKLLTDDEHDTLNTYESIGFFKSAMYQRIGIAVDKRSGQMLVAKTDPEADIAWHKVGQAQLWYSTTSKICVLWECLAFGKEMKPRVKELWEWTIRYCEHLEMKWIYTHDRDPAYDDDYKEFLESLGFELVREGTMVRNTLRQRYGLPTRDQVS